MTLPAFAATTGSASPTIVFVGEAWGQTEDLYQKPFVGYSGREFTQMLFEANPTLAPDLQVETRQMFHFGEAWIRPRERWLNEVGFALTNVLAFRPPENKIENICLSKKEVGAGYQLPPIAKGKYLPEKYFPELLRLEEELLAWRPNLVVALGNTALWALCQTTAISSVRGTTRLGQLGSWSGKVLPTYHPAGICRNWPLRPIGLADLFKASREGASPLISRPARDVLVSPTISQIEQWTAATRANPPKCLSCDTETKFGQITEIGFARDWSDAIVIPFVNLAKPNGSHWDKPDELRAWTCVETLLRLDCEKVFQNGLYDLRYILPLGIRPTRLSQDTMLKHHALFPELQKGLGFLGSIYTDEPAWKLMRTQKADTEKRDE